MKPREKSTTNNTDRTIRVGRAAVVIDRLDTRFRTLLPRDVWLRLPEIIRQRFSKRVRDGDSVVYVGTIERVRISRVGCFLAQALRVIGAPLPLSAETGVPSVVSVTEDGCTSGQNWTRLYANRTGFPQVVHSCKRFRGPTGLEEYIGFGIVMALKTEGTEQALIFKSAGYYFSLGALRLKIPNFLTPGALTVEHRDEDGFHFTFALTLVHPLFGELIYQAGLYHEEKL